MTAKDTHLVDEAFFDRLMNINVKSVFHSVSAVAPMYVSQLPTNTSITNLLTLECASKKVVCSSMFRP